jgi:hypothetical protein
MACKHGAAGRTMSDVSYSAVFLQDYILPFAQYACDEQTHP